MRPWFAAVFALSGAAALIYEVAWTRLLTLVVGHGVAAASTVLAAFMGGLAAGSAVGGRVGARLEPVRALRTYAALEVGIGALALVLPFALKAIEPLLGSAYADGAGGAWFGFLRVATSLLLLSLPAAAMGATFPVASRWFVQDAHRAATDAGWLYAANTMGAAAGAVAAGFVLLPALGLHATTWMGVLLNALAAGGAWWIAGRPVPEAPRRTPTADRTPRPDDPSGAAGRTRRRGRPVTHAPRLAPPQPLFAACALGISGFASLVLQVIWTRLLALILGPTTYAFSITVAVFIAGIAAGSTAAARVAGRVRQPLAGLATCLALAVGGAALAGAFVDRSLLVTSELVARADATFGTVVLQQTLLATGLLAPMTIAFGAAFPFAVAVATRTDASVPSDLGLIYAVNTTGAVAGALAAGFLLIPWLGLYDSLRLVTVMGAAGALALLLAGRAPGRPAVMAAVPAVAVLTWGMFMPRWDRLLLSSGGYKYAPLMSAPDLKTALTAGELLYYREGATGTVSVRRLAGTTSLAIDGKVDASNAGDMLTQRLLAHVPLLLHPEPKKVAILGLGSGVTLGSALQHPITRVDVLEISPGVVEAARLFDAENHGALSDPRTRLVIGDGRTHLLHARERYDVIVSEPSNPWMAGIATLFTREFFLAARERLNPGGILCQWAHTYDISTRDLQSIVATFLSVFPDGTLWLVGDGDVLLVGSTGPLDARLGRIAESWRRPGVADDLASVGALEPFHLLSLFVDQGAGLATWTAGAPLQTDDRATLEFSGPRAVFERSLAGDNASLLRAHASGASRPEGVALAVTGATASSWRDRGWMLYRADAARPAFDDFVRALEADPHDPRALEGLIRASAPIRRRSEARTLLGRLASQPTRLHARIALSRLLASEGSFDEAARLVLDILRADPGHVAALEQLASVLSDAGDIERLKPVVVRLRAEAPSSEAALYYTATLLFMEDRVDLALAEARRVLDVSPGHARAQNLVGACLATLGRSDEARTAFRASLAADPRDPTTYTNLARLELEAGNQAGAAKLFAEALTIDPTAEPARQGLADAQRGTVLR